MHNFIELILTLLNRGGILAIAAVVVCAVGVLAGYAVFRLVTHGEKKFPWRKTILCLLLVGYLVILLYATILRFTGGYREVNLHLFRGWREAWNGFTAQLWLNVLLNIALFVPLGILLPLIGKGFRKWYRMLLTGCGVTLLVEIVQYITARGLFDVDDLFNNALGAMIGYGLVMFFITVFGDADKKWRKSLAYAAVPLIPAVAVAGIFIGYHLQEYGNFRDAAAFTVNTSGVTWDTVYEPEDAGAVVPVYKTGTFTKESCDAFGADFAEKMGITFPDVYYYDGLTIFCNHSTGDFLHVYYHDGSYEYSVGNVPTNLEYAEADEETMRALLEPYGIVIPENAEFTYEGNGKHVFTVSMEPVGDSIVDGTLSCWYRKGDVLDRFHNNMLTFDYYKDTEVCSPAAAYERLCSGKFSNGAFFEYYSPESISVLSCTLEYRTDTKGFYRPVYMFALTDHNAFTTSVMVDAAK